ncbi:MAG: hypothetical protein H6995_03980 [Pseudomonadales bacterium]|nr:hypothetical protein [Pseudomonadales bacterium]MCP5214151.1 hypothetical protein [Pseudomonadales bacterium]MCP5302656.1 hypothetical protein [Pseudomonadales bacterium]
MHRTEVFETIPFTHFRTIPFGDTDAAAIVYTPRFVDYCMEAIEVWFKQYIGIDWYWINVRDQRGTPVVHLELDFTGPLIGGDELGITLEVGEIGRSTLTLKLVGSRGPSQGGGGSSVFNAKFVFCFVDTSENKSIPIPVESLEKIHAYKNVMQAEAG